MISFIACGCNNKTTTKQVEVYQKVSPDFNADSAYAFVQKQVDFGPRVPNTPQHVACGDYLVNELKRFGAEIIEQKVTLTAYNGTKLNARNIIGSYATDKKDKILLFAHWDTRPYADHDLKKENYHTPILGANDGASGVGVLLEIARQLQKQKPEVGIDIIFFDAEDIGVPAFSDQHDNNSWCLGSQYWSQNLHSAGYNAKYGILLDMVGATDATFYKEGFSVEYAANTIERIWSTARQLGYGDYFQNKNIGYITDDHVPVNQFAHIPSVDIIHLNKNGGFFPHWHTVNDNMNNISKETLKAVGQTVLEVIYKEK